MVLNGEIVIRPNYGRKQIVLHAFRQYGRLSWDDFFEMSLFKDPYFKDEGVAELKDILVELMDENFIKPYKNDWLSWEYIEKKM